MRLAMRASDAMSEATRASRGENSITRPRADRRDEVRAVGLSALLRPYSRRSLFRNTMASSLQGTSDERPEGEVRRRRFSCARNFQTTRDSSSVRSRRRFVQEDPETDASSPWMVSAMKKKIQPPGREEILHIFSRAIREAFPERAEDWIRLLEQRLNGVCTRCGRVLTTYQDIECAACSLKEAEEFGMAKRNRADEIEKSIGTPRRHPLKKPGKFRF